MTRHAEDPRHQVLGFSLVDTEKHRIALFEDLAEAVDRALELPGNTALNEERITEEGERRFRTLCVIPGDYESPLNQ